MCDRWILSHAAMKFRLITFVHFTEYTATFSSKYELAALPLDPHDAQQVHPVLGCCICCYCKLNTHHLIPIRATPCSQPLSALYMMTHGIGSVTNIPQLSKGFNSKDFPDTALFSSVNCPSIRQHIKKQHHEVQQRI